MKIFIILYGLFLTLHMNAQNIQRSDLVNSKWFSDNSDEKFHLSDTIYLTKFLDYRSEDKLDDDFGILYFNNKRDTETLKFMKDGSLQEWELSFDFCQPLGGIGDWTWSFDATQQIIKMNYADNINKKYNQLSFKITNRKDEIAKWKDEDEITNFSADLMILQLVRIK